MELVTNQRCAECGLHCASLVRIGRGGPFCWDCLRSAVATLAQPYGHHWQMGTHAGGGGKGGTVGIKNALIDRASPGFFTNEGEK